MTLLYSDPVFLDHDTGEHPERAQRLLQVMSHLRRIGLDARCARPSWESASIQRVERVHELSYVSAVADFAGRGGGRIEVDTVVCPASYRIALYAAGAVCDAVCRVVNGEDLDALCLIRPPGHHALRDSAMGFCLFNNVAIGAEVATQELDVDRVLIVDWDVHHGNATQDAFWTSERVAFFSMHRWPFYPGTGSAEETGSGPGLGATRNVPVEFGTSRKEILQRFAAELGDLAARVRPDLVMISAGFDAHRDDPVGSLRLETEDFQELTKTVLEIAEAYGGGRVVSALEGGYNPSAMAGSVEVHLRELLDRENRGANSRQGSTPA